MPSGNSFASDTPARLVSIAAQTRLTIWLFGFIMSVRMVLIPTVCITPPLVSPSPTGAMTALSYDSGRFLFSLRYHRATRQVKALRARPRGYRVTRLTVSSLETVNGVR